MAASGFLIKFVRVLGWIILIFNALFVVVLLFSFGSAGFDSGSVFVIVFFAVFAGFGFFLTRYKKGKRAAPIVETVIPDKTLMDKQQKEIENLIQKQNELQNQLDVLKIHPKNEEKPAALPPGPEEVENTRKKLGVTNDKIFHIVYEDSHGNITDRDINIIKLSKSYGKKSVYAFCHTKLSIRQFIISRIISMTENGQKIEDVPDYLQRNYAPPSGESLANIALED
jgi:hypothetical protein